MDPRDASASKNSKYLVTHHYDSLILIDKDNLYLDAKSSQVILLHSCHVSMIRYNNMQVNPDGSLATNQTNESNHNTAKVSTKYIK